MVPDHWKSRGSLTVTPNWPNDPAPSQQVLRRLARQRSFAGVCIAWPACRRVPTLSLQPARRHAPADAQRCHRVNLNGEYLSEERKQLLGNDWLARRPEAVEPQ